MTVMLTTKSEKEIDTKREHALVTPFRFQNQLCGIFLMDIIPGKYWTFGVLLNLTRHHLYLLSTVVDGKRIKERLDRFVDINRLLKPGFRW